MNKVDELEKQLELMRKEEYSKKFPMFDDLTLIKDTIERLEKSTNYQMDVFGDVVLIHDTIILNLSQDDEQAFYYYMETKDIGASRISQGYYHLWKKVNYKFLIDIRTGQWDNGLVFQVYDNTGWHIGTVKQDDIANHKDVMIRDYNKIRYQK